VQDPYAIGERFFRWEIATAVRFDHRDKTPQPPDVEASKGSNAKAHERIRSNWQAASEEPFFEGDGGEALRRRKKNADALKQGKSLAKDPEKLT